MKYELYDNTHLYLKYIIKMSADDGWITVGARRKTPKQKSTKEELDYQYNNESNYSRYSHQDWKPVVLKSQQPTTSTSKKQLPEQLVRKEKSKSTGLVPVIGSAIKIDSVTGDEYDDMHIPKTSHSTAQKIQQARVAKKLTQAQLAIQCNLPASIIRDYENGTGTPNPEHFAKISRVLGVSLSTKN